MKLKGLALIILFSSLGITGLSAQAYDPDCAYFNGGSSFFGGVNFNFEWEVRDRLSLLSGIGFGLLNQIDQVPSYGTAYLVNLHFEPQYYITSDYQKGAFLGLFASFGLMDVPMRATLNNQVLYLYYQKVFGEYGIRLGFKWFPIEFGVSDTQIRINIQPSLNFRQSFYEGFSAPDYNQGIVGPVNWFGVCVELNFETLSYQATRINRRDSKKPVETNDVKPVDWSVTNDILVDKVTEKDLDDKYLSNTNVIDEMPEETVD